MDYRILADELAGDPLGRGYAGMTDAAAATPLNTANRAVERGLVAAHEIFEAIVPSDWTVLSAAEKQRLQTIMSLGEVNLRGTNTRAALAAAFGAGTATRTALVALQSEMMSRAAELGLSAVAKNDVTVARGGRW